MLDGLFNSTTIPVLEQVVQFSEARHTVLAGNIANLDTPGYQVRDLSVEDFRERLKEAVEARHEPPPPRTGSPGDLPVRHEDPLAKVARDPKTILYHDKSNVGMEHQVTEMVKNQMQHNLALTIMANQFQLLQTVISGRV